MRILVVNPFGGGEAEANENFDLIKRPDTTYDIVNLMVRQKLLDGQEPGDETLQERLARGADQPDEATSPS